jgi:hypothetical protein
MKKDPKSGLTSAIAAKFNDGFRLVQGVFKAEAFDMAQGGKRIYYFLSPNKIVAGSTSLLLELIAGRTQSWTPGSDIYGVTKFVLHSIDETVVAPDCQAQMLVGTFTPHYNNLDPVLLSEINAVSFPCLRSDSIITAETVPVNDCASLVIPGLDGASLSSDIVTDHIDICVKIGQGHVPVGQVRYYALAALVGNSPDPADLDTTGSKTDYVYALEQFPVMVKRSTVTFAFTWTLFFAV